MFDMILNKSQWLHAFDQSMLESQFKIESQSAFHRLIYPENDVLRQVVSQLLDPHRDFILIRLHNLFDMRDAFVTRAREVDLAYAQDGLVARHPHRKNEPETGVFLPETRHVPNVQSLSRKRHARIADDQGRIVFLQHLFEVWRARGPFRLALKKFSKDHFHERR